MSMRDDWLARLKDYETDIKAGCVDDEDYDEEVCTTDCNSCLAYHPDSGLCEYWGDNPSEFGEDEEERAAGVRAVRLASLRIDGIRRIPLGELSISSIHRSRL